jgi:uncharacterized protein
MASVWTALHRIPPTGKDFLLDEQAIWTEPLREFGIACRVETPLSAGFFVLPQENGVLVRGSMRGRVALACIRCMEDTPVELRHTFESFEPFPLPPGTSAEEDREVDREVVRRSPQTQEVEINLAALAWEEFSLALPVKPLCSAECKGLCPHCGVNRNHVVCDCRKDGGDPRLAVLRGLTVRR